MTDVTVESAVTTSLFRRLMARQMTGGDPATPLAYIVFGNGAVYDDGQIRSPHPDNEQIYNQLLEKPIVVASVVEENPYWLECTGVLESTDMAGEQLNEVGILDADRNLICHKTFPSRTKDPEERYLFKIYFKF